MRRSMLIPLLVISLGAPLLMSACNSQGKGEEGVGDVVEQINLNEKTSGQTFKLDKDGVVSVDVKASSGTPYAWKVTNSSPPYSPSRVKPRSAPPICPAQKRLRPTSSGRKNWGLAN